MFAENIKRILKEIKKNSATVKREKKARKREINPKLNMPMCNTIEKKSPYLWSSNFFLYSINFTVIAGRYCTGQSIREDESTL